MAKNHRCGCDRRNSNNMGCLNSVGGCRRWENFPYYDGCCPDGDGGYDRGCGGAERCNDREERRCGGVERCNDREERRCGPRNDLAVYGLFSASLPMAVAANGVVPLTRDVCGRDDFCVNSGRISLRDAGVYLATMTVQAAADVASTFALRVNDVAQPTAIIPAAGEGFSATAQTIFDASAGDTVSVVSQETVNVTEPSLQPMVTLTLVRLD